jgi:hypothetical protein
MREGSKERTSPAVLLQENREALCIELREDRLTSAQLLSNSASYSLWQALSCATNVCKTGEKGADSVCAINERLSGRKIWVCRDGVLQLGYVRCSAKSRWRRRIKGCEETMNLQRAKR